jgi:pimeloyl-ACP methyl ester carboxylesterase/acyl carrier protein
MIDAVVQVAKLEDASPLLDIVSAGESLKLTEPLRDFLQAHPQCRLHNHYGPTETHVVTETMVSLADFDAAEASIGRPIPNCACVILDQNARRVPRGAIGELYLAGACLASGYVGKENLTSERFVALPDLGSPHLRYYRTGDLARWRYDGKLDFLGRADTQVKHRGFRIELGEIEAMLGSHPSIAQCVVVLREDRPGDKRLVAYYTLRGDPNPTIFELREFLGSKLPEYMVPAAFVRLDTLPLTPSGKIDRRTLPLPDIKDVGVQDQYAPPRNGVEEQLAQIWSEVLGINRIGIHDNFFALGGHSLLAVRLFSEINNRLGRELPLSILFQQGTISQIAQFFDASIEDQPIARIVQLSSSKNGHPLVVMPGLNGELLYSKELVDRVEHRSNVVGLQPNLDPRFLEIYADFGRMASEYVKIIRAHQPLGPYRLIGYSYGGILGFEIARQLGEQGQAVDFCGVIDTGFEPDLSYRQLGSVAVHLARVSINLPRWIGASCGPEKFRKTVARANRKLRYFGRWILARGKTRFTLEDEFGVRKLDDHRRKVIDCLFQSLNDYKPKNYRGRVTLFRAITRPLFHHLSPDLGWSKIQPT